MCGVSALGLHAWACVCVHVCDFAYSVFILVFFFYSHNLHELLVSTCTVAIPALISLFMLRSILEATFSFLLFRV